MTPNNPLQRSGHDKVHAPNCRGSVEFSDYALEFLADQGFDPQFGARPLKRLIQKEIVNQLSRRILAGDIDKDRPVLVDVFDNTVVFRNEVPETAKASGKV